MGILAASDRAAGSVARAATTLGQLALVALGVHLAADQLDDRFVAALLAAQSGLDALLSQPAAAVAGAFGWEAEALQLWQRAPIAPLAAAGALAVEVAALTLFAGSFLLTERAPALTLGGWRRVRSAHGRGANLKVAKCNMVPLLSRKGASMSAHGRGALLV